MGASSFSQVKASFLYQNLVDLDRVWFPKSGSPWTQSLEETASRNFARTIPRNPIRTRGLG